MKKRRWISLGLALSVAGCASGSLAGLPNGSAPATAASVLRVGDRAVPADIAAAGIAVANARGNTVTQYRTGLAPTTLPTAGLPNQAVFDRLGDLYVPTPRELMVYRPPSAAPVRVVPGYAAAVAIDRDGRVYVAEEHAIAVYSAGAEARLHSFPTSAGSNTYIAVNPSGSVIAVIDTYAMHGHSATLLTEYANDGRQLVGGIGIGNQLTAVAIGPSDDVYVAGVNFSQPGLPGEIAAFSPGTTTRVRTIQATVRERDGIAFDAKGDLWIADFSASQVRDYGPSGNTPIRTITSGVSQPVGVAFGAGGALYVLNYFTSLSIYAPDASAPWRTLAATHRVDGLAVAPSGPFALVSRGDATVLLYPPAVPSLERTTTGGIAQPWSLAFDRAKNEYVANRANDTVTVYAPGATTPSRTISDGIKNPSAIALDSADDLYVANRGANDVTVYGPQSGAPLRTISQGVNAPLALALDAHDHLYVANSGNDSVTVYGPKQVDPSRTITDGIASPDALAIDAAGDLYVANDKSASVLAFPPGSAVFERRITGGISAPAALAVDPSGNLYVANSANDSVTEYAANSAKLARTLSSGLAHPVALAFDSSGLILVASEGNNAVVGYSMTSTSPAFSITDGIDQPHAIALP